MVTSGRFAGKGVLVTGASSGIGRATALAYGAEGAHVLAVARRADGLKDLVHESDGAVDTMVADVRDSEAVHRAVERAAEWGRIDVLVNNAGVAVVEPFLEVTAEHWDDVVATNLTGAFHASQQVARHMVGAGGGVIVNVASTDAFVAESPFGAYSVSKAGLVQLTRCIAFELGHLGVRCNAVCPGLTVTEMTSGDLGASFSEAYLRRIPLRRFGTPEDQARAILFLSSDEASFINGASLLVDGGQLSGFWYYPELEPPADLGQPTTTT